MSRTWLRCYDIYKKESILSRKIERSKRLGATFEEGDTEISFPDFLNIQKGELPDELPWQLPFDQIC